MTDHAKIHHLYRRAGFGLSPQEWLKLREMTFKDALEDLFARTQVPAKVLQAGQTPDYTRKNISPKERMELQKQERKDVSLINVRWLKRMASPKEDALLEKMCLFWHGHFACETKFSLLATQQLNTLRKYALGNFRDLLLAIARDPSMIRYLNNQQNRKLSPNENFAREVMELFTLGRGNYTETDVKEAARAFTGWSSNLKGEFFFRARLHDYGTKTFLGKTGEFDGTDILDMILEQPAAAVFICRKIYRYFVNEEVDEVRVQELADSFRQNYDIGQLMRTIFSSDWFYAPNNIGNKIKSPVELLAGLMRQLNVSDISPQGIIILQLALGQVLFRPPNVAGWPGGRYWIDNSTLLLRLNLAAAIFQAGEFNFELAPELEQDNKRQLKKLGAVMNLEPLKQLAAISSAELSKLLLAATSSPSLKLSPASDLQALQLMSSPEYQVC